MSVVPLLGCIIKPPPLVVVNDVCLAWCSRRPSRDWKQGVYINSKPPRSVILSSVISIVVIRHPVLMHFIALTLW